MKSIIAYTAAVVIFIAAIVFFLVQFRAKAVNATLQVTVAVHDGHQYLVFVPATSGDFAVVHSASCPKH